MLAKFKGALNQLLAKVGLMYACQGMMPQAHVGAFLSIHTRHPVSAVVCQCLPGSNDHLTLAVRCTHLAVNRVVVSKPLTWIVFLFMSCSIRLLPPPPTYPPSPSLIQLTTWGHTRDSAIATMTVGHCLPVQRHVTQHNHFLGITASCEIDDCVTFRSPLQW